MKKIFSILMIAVLLLSVLSLAGCGSKTLKFGLGTVAYTEDVKSVDGVANGAAGVVSTIAAVLVDNNGKIVKCEIDCADTTLNFNGKGEFIVISEFKTKKELGENYGMKKAGAKKEWFEQADAFEGVVAGKTIDEVKALVANEGKGSDAVISAGCTIAIADFVAAIEKAVNNAKDSKATKNDTLKLGIVTSQSGKNAENETAGNNEIETTISAITTNKDGKVTAAITDAFSASVVFDIKGITSTKAGDIATKLELGEEYGMKKAGAKKEWFEQTAAFDAQIIGKNSNEIGKLVTSEGKGTDEIVNAGCTITVSDCVKAAVKAASK